jgi:hypothetical protein
VKELVNKTESKPKFDLLKLFKSTRDKKGQLLKKIDKFADKKASHFVWLRKLKEKDPFSSDILDRTQIRSLSRTFTGRHDLLKHKSMFKISEPESVYTPSANGKRRNNLTERDFLGDFSGAEEKKEIKEDEKEEESINQSVLGEFYDEANLHRHGSIFFKYDPSSNLVKKDSAGGSSKTQENDLSSQVRKDMKEALSPADIQIIEKTKSMSQDEEVKLDDEDLKSIEEKGRETAAQQEKRIRKQSIFGHLKTWKLLRIIVKAGDDLRQEQFAMQLISQIDQIFKRK